jgi:hypothetical protein
MYEFLDYSSGPGELSVKCCVPKENGQFRHNRASNIELRMKILEWNDWLEPKLVFPTNLVINWVSSCLSFILSASTAATNIFTAPTCTTTIITLEPCALNAEFQHFILRFNKISLLCGYHWKTIEGESSRPKDNSSISTFYIETQPIWVGGSTNNLWLGDYGNIP